MLFILKGIKGADVFWFRSAWFEGGKEIGEGKYCGTGVFSSWGTGFPDVDVGTLVP
jgi:hypothetical protein